MSLPMTSTPTASTPPRPWFREPLVWLVIGLPAMVVVAGVWTLVVAARAGGADSVPDTVRRTAQVQQADLGPDREAARLGLEAELAVDASSGALQTFSCTPGPSRAGSLSANSTAPCIAQDSEAQTRTVSAGGAASPSRTTSK